MRKRSPVMNFFLIFVIYYSSALLFTSAFKFRAGGFVVFCGNRFLNNPIKNSFVSFHNKKEKFDVEVRVGNINQQVNNSIPSFIEGIDSTQFLYMPMIFLISLFLASPVNGKRKIHATISGLIIFILVIMLRLYILVMKIALTHVTLGLTTTTFHKKLVDILNNTFVSSGSMILFIDVFIWIVFTFNRNDISLLISKPITIDPKTLKKLKT